MAGTQNFLLAVGMRESAKVTKMLRQIMPITVAFINAQFAAGADIVVLADHATRNLVGPYHYEQYLLPIHQEITAQVGGPIILHVCGNCSDRLELFARSGVDAYHFEWQVDSREAVRRIGDKISLVGNVNNPQTAPSGNAGRRLQTGPLCHRGRRASHRAGVRHPAQHADRELESHRGGGPARLLRRDGFGNAFMCNLRGGTPWS